MNGAEVNTYCPRCGVSLAECVCRAPAGIAKARRERIATAVLGHMIAAAVPIIASPDQALSLAVVSSIQLADALIAELDK